jgi:heat shock protein HslJ
MRRILPALVAMVGLAPACGDTPNAPSDLTGRTWRLVSLDRSGGTIAVASPDRYTVRFDADRLAVRSDCNSCGGSYAIAGTTLQVGPLACTRAYCGDASLDADFSQALGSATSISENGGTLLIQSPGVTLRFVE